MDDEHTDAKDRQVRPYIREHGYNSHRGGWDEDRIEKLRSLWADGLSASLIADRLGGFQHCSDNGRSSVIGKLNRLGLKRSVRDHGSGPSHPRRKRISKAQQAHRERLGMAFFGKRDRQPDAALPPLHETDVARISFIDLEDHHCRFVTLDQPAGPYVKQFCGTEREPGSAYCSAHVARAYDQQPPRQRPQPIRLVPTFESYVKEDA